LFSQTEDYNWIFNATGIENTENYPDRGPSVLSFNKLPPFAYKSDSIIIHLNKTNAIISDLSSNPLIYTNGQTIHGPKHKPIVNGDRINNTPVWENLSFFNEHGELKPTGFKLTQACGLFQIPERDNEYLCLYHNYENRDSTGFYTLMQSHITENENGEFEIIEKDKIINERISKSGSIQGCRHANGRDWWMLQFNKDTVYTYLIDPRGLSLDTIQTISNEVIGTFGQSKFNSDGSKFALISSIEGENYGVEVFFADFDRTNGILIESFYDDWRPTYQYSGLSLGLEFSENSSKLYISVTELIYQYDFSDNGFEKVEVAKIEETFCDSNSVFESNFFGIMQRGPDHKIYVTIIGQCFELHRINNPNKMGYECDVEQSAIILPTYHRGTVPTLNTYRLGPLDGSEADTLDIDNHPVSRFWYEQPDTVDKLKLQFYDVSYFRPEVWHWDFGDGFTSSERSPEHSYNDYGVYEVCLTVSNENSSHTSCDTLNLGMVNTQDDLQFDYGINLFPNPVEDYTRLAFQNYIPVDGIVTIYNAAGSRVLNEKLNGIEQVLDLSFLESGAYVFEIIDRGVVLKTGRLVKI